MARPVARRRALQRGGGGANKIESYALPGGTSEPRQPGGDAMKTERPTLTEDEKAEIEYQAKLQRIRELEQSEPSSKELEALRASLTEYETKLGRDYAKQ
ncbi:hypothetical protein [Bosea sp. BK604]|uniref:hypothetical protein n=1 Tax=Bosea sp. BK604 TaxID=2512180 RepID=UPI00104DCD50|nr:hypothetical protein [Bosea sp. BK604]